MVDLDTLEALAKAATQGEWEWWNGCSWWRLGAANRDRTRVIEPTCDSDGHPNLIVRAEDRRYIEAAQPRAVLTLLDEIERLRGALGKLLALPLMDEQPTRHHEPAYQSDELKAVVAEATAALAPKEKNDG